MKQYQVKTTTFRVAEVRRAGAAGVAETEEGGVGSEEGVRSEKRGDEG